jgi:hypothetical protein
MSLKGFGEEEDVPRAGTMAHLRYVEKKKRKEKTATEQLREATQTEPLTGFGSTAPIDTVTEPDTVVVSISNHPLEPPSLSSDILIAISSYILTTTPRMTDWEARIYRYLVGQAYATEDASGLLYYHQRTMMKALGLTSPPTVSRSMKGLEKRKLIRWVQRARGRGQTSRLRVNLPPK